jgi:hypothetical protein
MLAASRAWATASPPGPAKCRCSSSGTKAGRDEPGTDALLDALHEDTVLCPNLAVERKQLLDPLQVGARREEVAEGPA